MAIGFVEMQGQITRAQDFTTIKQNEDNKSMLQQEIVEQHMTKQVKRQSNRVNQSEQPEQKKCDRVLILVLVIIIVTGLVILYSTSAYNGEIKFQDTFYYLKKQIFATLLGIMGMWCIANIDYHIWKKWAVPGYLLSILL